MVPGYGYKGSTQSIRGDVSKEHQLAGGVEVAAPARIHLNPVQLAQVHGHGNAPAQYA